MLTWKLPWIAAVYIGHRDDPFHVFSSVVELVLKIETDQLFFRRIEPEP